MGQDRPDAETHTRRSIGKVIPLRQHRRNPAFGSALARLVAGGSASAVADDLPLGPIRSLLATARAVEARHDEALEAGANLAHVARGALSELRSHLTQMAEVVADPDDGAGERLARRAQEITRVAHNAEFAGRPLLAGSEAPAWREPGTGAERLELRLADHSAPALGVARIAPDDANAAPRIAAALARVDETRAALDDFEQDVDAVRRERAVARENLAAAGALPADVAGALEQARFVRDRVVADLRRAARSQGVAPAVALRLIG